MGRQFNERETIRVMNEKVDLTSPDKLLWPKKKILKIDYLQYLHDISPHLLPFLKDRALTVIRYPHGVEGESFYQKNCPNYAPEYIQTYRENEIDYIVCSDLPTLIWLGNQLAFELHIPFETIGSQGPSEIVFDLDPPSRDEFTLAVEAALIMKEIFDELHLISFVKTSGNKGLQIYIPLPENQFSYADTRLFTKFIAEFLVSKQPKWFTIERLKVNRGQKLYIDYVQHARGKTMIAPYSVRGNEDALVATPLFWDEVHYDLSPLQFPLETIKDRLKEKSCPFKAFFRAKEKQPFTPVLQWMKEKGIKI